MFNKLSKFLFVYILLGFLSVMANAADINLPQPAVHAAQNKIEHLLSASHADDAPFIIIDVKNQTLYLFEHRKLKQSFPVSTSAIGVGNAAGSNRTPLGLHKIAEKFGNGEPIGMIFKARKPSGTLASIQTQPIKGDGDDVTTRIMWLQGLEPGVNEGQGVDSHARYIYIHGTPEEGLIGTPESHGCVRMNNTQVIELFNQVPVGTLVDIVN